MNKIQWMSVQNEDRHGNQCRWCIELKGKVVCIRLIRAVNLKEVNSGTITPLSVVVVFLLNEMREREAYVHVLEVVCSDTSNVHAYKNKTTND